MKTFTFLPGLVVVFAFTVLLIATQLFQLNIPVLKNFKQPLIPLAIAGLMMCAFGTLAHTMSSAVTSAHVDWMLVVTVLVGVLILLIAGFGIFSDKPVFGLLSKNAAFYAVASLLGVKVLLSTARILWMA